MSISWNSEKIQSTETSRSKLKRQRTTGPLGRIINVAGTNSRAVNIVVKSLTQFFSEQYPAQIPPKIQPHFYANIGYYPSGYYAKDGFHILVGTPEEKRYTHVEYDLWVNCTSFKASELEPLVTNKKIHEIMGGQEPHVTEEMKRSDSSSDLFVVSSEKDEEKVKPTILLYGINRIILDLVVKEMQQWIVCKYSQTNFIPPIVIKCIDDWKEVDVDDLDDSVYVIAIIVSCYEPSELEWADYVLKAYDTISFEDLSEYESFRHFLQDYQQRKKEN
jgi:hypothetical protein